MTVNYRNGYNLFTCNGVLFNHESPRRGETFVTRKITRAIARILAEQQEKVYLENLEAKRDWGYAPEYVESMWLMLQQEKPDDYVIGTGEARSVREFAQAAFSYAHLDWENYVAIDPRYFRPTEVSDLCADACKAKRRLDWSPNVNFKDLVTVMVDADMEAVGLEPIGRGRNILTSSFSRWHQWSSAVTSLYRNQRTRFE